MPQPTSPRVVVITGAAGGIGSTTALRFSSDGESVVLIDVLEAKDRLEKVRDSVRKAGAHAVSVITANVTMPRSEVNPAIAKIMKDYGRIDVLVNCAGIIQKLAAFVRTDLKDARNVFKVNYWGTFYMCHVVLPHMQRNGYGRIVNVASVVAKKGDAGNAVYAASKAAVVSLTRTLAHEAPYAKEGLVPDITVNAVLPGITDTPMVEGIPQRALERYMDRVPQKRKATPEEIASMIHYLASDEARFVNGVAVEVDGGYLRG